MLSRTLDLGPCSVRVHLPEHSESWLGRFPQGIEEAKPAFEVWLSGPTPLTSVESSIPGRRSSGRITFESEAHFRGWYEPAIHRAEIEIGEGEPEFWASDRIVYGILRTIFCCWVAENGGLCLHGSTLVGEAGAYAFVGKTRAGKTTLAERFPFQGVLGDDLVVLLPAPDTGQLFAWGTPFSGSEGMKARLEQRPLAALSLLYQNTETTASRMAPGEAIPQVLRHVFVHVDHQLDRQRALDRIAELCVHTPIYRHGQSLDRSPWDLEIYS